MKINKAITAQTIVDEFYHHNIHTEQLLKIYPDLTIINTSNSIEYYSNIINCDVDQYDLKRDSLYTYVYLHSANPFKNVKIECSKCDNLIKVNSNPSKIPVFLEAEISYGTEYTLYGLLYEEILKLNNFNSNVLKEIQLYVISKLEDHNKLNHRIDISNLNNSIKKLLPFI